MSIPAAMVEEEQKDGSSRNVGVPFASEPIIESPSLIEAQSPARLRSHRSQSLDVGGSMTMRSLTSTGSSRRRSSKPGFLKKIAGIGKGKHRSTTSDDSVSGSSTASMSAQQYLDAEAVQTASLAEGLEIRSPLTSPGKSPTSGLTSPRSRRKSNSAQQLVLQQQQQMLLHTQQKQQDRMARLETLLESQASRQTSALSEVASLRASLRELAQQQRALAEQTANDRAFAGQLAAVGLGCFVTASVGYVVSQHSMSPSFFADESMRRFFAGDARRLALSVGLVWLVLGLLYVARTKFQAQPQAKSQETVKEADPSNAESNRSTTTKTPVALATDASQSSNASHRTSRSRKVKDGSRRDSQPLVSGNSRLDLGADVNTREGSGQDACPSGGHAMHVSSEYGISHEVWLNHFDGMDIPLEDCVHYQAMTPDQVRIFREFRKEVLQKLGTFQGLDRRLPYPVPDDFSIMRFLQADKYSKTMASERLLGTLVWRQKKKLHELVATAPEKLETYRRLRVRKCMGWSKQGMPVFVERIGEFITSLSSDLAKTMTVQDWLDCYMYEMAGLILEFRKGAAQGNVQWKMLFIADMRGVKFMQAFRSINLLKAFAKEVEVHFPEQAGPVFLINTPSVVHSAWKLAKQFLDPVVLAKIQLHPNAATNVLLEHMDEDVLFEEYGGKNRDHFPHAEIH